MDESPQHADWRRWLEDHAPKFLLFARQQVRYEADAQDLVQEAVVVIGSAISPLLGALPAAC